MEPVALVSPAFLTMPARHTQDPGETPKCALRMGRGETPKWAPWRRRRKTHMLRTEKGQPDLRISHVLR